MAEEKKTTTKTTAAKKTTTPKAATTKKATTTKTAATKKVEEVKVEAPKAEVVEAKKAPAKKAVAKKANGPMLKITLVKSASGRLVKQQRTLEALGLTKINSVTVKPDNAQTKGMIFVVKHLVKVESVKEN